MQEQSDNSSTSEKTSSTMGPTDGTGDERAVHSRSNRSRAKSLSVGDLRSQNRGTLESPYHCLAPSSQLSIYFALTC
jgi:hypothetical protein